MTELRSQSNDPLPDSELAKELQFQLASRAEKRRYDQGIVVVKQGEEADGFFVILSGDAEVIQERENRPPRIIATLSGGDHFGEIGLFEGIRRTASVRVSGSAGLEVLMLDRATFQEFVTSSEQTEEEIAAIVKQRLRTLQLATALPSLHADELSRISPQLERMKFGPGEIIVKQGDPADRFYILVSGRCQVIDHHPDGHDITVDWREPGEYFGEIGLIQNQPRTATIKAGANSEVEVLVLERDEFLAMTKDSKATEMAIAQEMIQRMIDMAEVQ